MSAWTVLAVLFWMALGAAIALSCVILRGRRLWKKMADEGTSEFGGWLGRECEVLKGDTWRKCRVVAVSHKGAIAVRNVTDGSGRHAKWIPKEKVPERVRWVRSGE